MNPPDPARVAAVAPGSLAAQHGIAPGDRLLRINGRAPRDYIDYRYLIAEPALSLTLRPSSGRKRVVKLTKTLDQDLGIRFSEDVFDGLRTCRNRCPFCFVAQLPKCLRPALYLRDDDYRLSFLHGNFITLTNLTPADRRRIARLHLSPLYVSVHATEPEIRKRIFGRPTTDVLTDMRWLIARGITFHAQIVVSPGVNDGDHLDRTVADLAALYPGVLSIGLVPVGLTKHRRRNPSLRPVTAARAAKLIDRVHRWQRKFKAGLGTRLVFAADELYLRSGVPLPGGACYEGFWQLGNGIGCARRFLDAVHRQRPLRLGKPLRVTLVTGEIAAPLAAELAAKLASGGTVTARVCIVPNRLFGRSVTVAGLLSGADIAYAAERCGVGRLVLVPATAVREGEGFLDGMTVDDLSRRLGAEVIPAHGPADAAAALRRFDRRRSPS